MTLREAALREFEEQKRREEESLRLILEENARLLKEAIRRIDPKETFVTFSVDVLRDDGEKVRMRALKAVRSDIIFELPEHRIPDRVWVLMPCANKNCTNYAVVGVGWKRGFNLKELGEVLTQEHYCAHCRAQTYTGDTARTLELDGSSWFEDVKVYRQLHNQAKAY